MSDEPTNPETAAEPPVIESTGREIEAARPVARGEGTLLRHTPPRPTREALVPLDADAVIEGMKAYQDLLPKLLDASDYQGTGDGAFVKKSGWRKIARAFNLSVEIVSISILRDERDKPTRAECIARAMAPNGQIQDADGYCSIDEFTGKRAEDSKLENTLRATATTRAKNRAIADLVGMGEVSAEEVTTAGNSAPPFGPPVDEEGRLATSNALTFLLDGDAEKIWNAITAEAGGYMPVIASNSIRRIARVLAERDAKPKDEPEPTEEPEPEIDEASPPDDEKPIENGTDYKGPDPFAFDPGEEK